MKIQIAGPGCANCKTTEQRVIDACAELDLAADISHVYDYNEIAKLGVLRTPAVVIDGEIVVTSIDDNRIRNLIPVIAPKRSSSSTCGPWKAGQPTKNSRCSPKR